EAQALSESELLTSEPVTVVLSEKGWIRAAKGHDVDAAALSYRSGDAFKLSATGKSNQFAYLLDSTGRSYALPAHTLPSARSQGEPVTGRLNPPSGATFEAVVMGNDEQHILLCSDAGYGFVAKLGDLFTKNRAGKSVLTLPAGGRTMAPALIRNMDRDQVVAITNEGRMLVFPVKDLPEMARGKGNKIIDIPSKRVQSRDEYAVAITVVSEGAQLLVYSGRQHLNLNLAELEHYAGERGRRGNKLPRGYQRVSSIEVRKA